MGVWYVRDCAGIFCSSFAIMLTLFGTYAMIFGSILPSYSNEITLGSLFHCTLFSFLSFMALWSHWKCMTTDPGLFAKKTKQNKTKQNKTKQNKTKQNKTKQNKTKHKTKQSYVCLQV